MPIDMGQIGADHYFILRAGIGLEADMVGGADRDLKDRLGVLAYALAALQALQNPIVSHYTLTIDGQEMKSEGVACLICNSGNLGKAGVTLSTAVSVCDGVLDIFVLQQADLASLLALTRDVLRQANPTRPILQHWQGRGVMVLAEPNQRVQVDGELIGQTPITAKVLPSAVQVIVPKTASILQAPMSIE